MDTDESQRSMRAGYVASGVVNSLTRRCCLFVVQTSGTLINTGHDIRLILDDPSLHYVNISAGPLSYQYRVSELILHFGVTDSTGSEHTINGLSFPAEVRASLVCLLSGTRGHYGHSRCVVTVQCLGRRT